MARPSISPEKRKKPTSFTLTAEQRILCDWTAAQLGVSASELIGRLIEKEAKRVSRSKKCSLPDTNPDQTKIDA